MAIKYTHRLVDSTFYVLNDSNGWELFQILAPTHSRYLANPPAPALNNVAIISTGYSPKILPIPTQAIQNFIDNANLQNLNPPDQFIVTAVMNLLNQPLT